CGPTCLSMVCIYLLNDPAYTPKYVAEFAESNGYSVDGNGSAWTLISGGGKQLGLDVTEIPLDENRIIRNLEAGNPIICVMGPGDFTSTGHYIVLTRYTDGKVTVNDPNSYLRSERLWELTSVMEQIRNLWVCRA
ncbi:MAG: C39 family peptidase, partial [Lentisphaeria bacterium]|nr:C39 family peptidase [Lentisphaeria bacterium]